MAAVGGTRRFGDIRLASRRDPFLSLEESEAFEKRMSTMRQMRPGNGFEVKRAFGFCGCAVLALFVFRSVVDLF